MTPKEKAIELVYSFYEIQSNEYNYGINYEMAVQCALIAVILRLDGHFPFTSIDYGQDSSEYWEQVKSEIENL